MTPEERALVCQVARILDAFATEPDQPRAGALQALARVLLDGDPQPGCACGRPLPPRRPGAGRPRTRCTSCSPPRRKSAANASVAS